MSFVVTELSARLRLSVLPAPGQGYVAISLFLQEPRGGTPVYTALVPYLVGHGPVLEVLQGQGLDEPRADVFRVYGTRLLQTSVLLGADQSENEAVLERLCAALADSFHFRGWSVTPAMASEARAALEDRLQEAFGRDPLTRALTAVQDAMHPDAPCGLMPVPGGPEALAAAEILPDELEAYARDLFARTRVDLYVMGDVDPDQVLALARQLTLPGAEQPAMPAGEAESPVPQLPAEIRATCPGEQDVLVLGFRLPARFGEPGWPAMLVLDALLGSMAGSRLVKRLQTAGLVYFVMSGLDWVHGDLWVMAKCRPDETMHVRREIEQELAELSTARLAEEEVTAFRRAAAVRLRRGGANPFMYFRLNLEARLCGAPGLLEEIAAAVGAVSADQIQQVAHATKLAAVYHGCAGDRGSEP